MATESDCVSFQTSLASGAVYDSSLLPTPALTPPSSCASSTDGSESSFFSALSCNDSNSLHPSVHPIPEMVFLNHVEFPSKIPSLGSSISSPHPLPDCTTLAVSLAPRRPRKLRKSRPYVPKLSLDSSSEYSLPISSSNHRRPLVTSPIQLKVLKRTRQNSLPPIPSATFYPADKSNRGEFDKDLGEKLRAIQFVTPLGSHSKPLRRPWSPPPRTLTRNASTHALVSLAWTGRIPSFLWSSQNSASGSESLGSACSTWSEDDKDIHENSSSSRAPPQRSLGRTRRWSLATAITSDEISDEMFVNEVEGMRMRGTFWQTRKSLDSLLSSGTSAPELNHTLPNLTDPILSATWQTARRALLTCRELIRTERSYLASLLVLASNGTATPAPSLMLTYIPALLQASEGLLLKMEANPSAQGVAEAFIECGSQLEAGFMAWCGVSGGFFIGSQTVHDRAARTSVLWVMDSSSAMPLKRRVTKWVQSKRRSSFKGREGAAEKTNEPSMRNRSPPTVRDLAILPIQRVMRYTLLFRDLLENVSSSSSSYIYVERALHVATAIAQKSDRAQGNAAFLQQAA
ncbi:hypothetical protein B0H19DRAFT_644498 [Mycena capillaripes]|nr:hypothetical protein B0H19DRAFT_644498 [Mycena capillaripes]